MSSLEKEVNGRFLLHAIQLSPLSSYKEHEFSQFFTLTPLGEKTLSFAVKVSATLYVHVQVNIYTRSEMCNIRLVAALSLKGCGSAPRQTFGPASLKLILSLE